MSSYPILSTVRRTALPGRIISEEVPPEKRARIVPMGDGRAQLLTRDGVCFGSAATSQILEPAKAILEGRVRL